MAKEPNRDQNIRTSGLLQAIITAETPIEQWESSLRYALLLQSAFSHRLAGHLIAMPQLPKKGK